MRTEIMAQTGEHTFEPLPSLRVYTRDEQMESLRCIVRNSGWNTERWIGQRPFARVVWNAANGREEVALAELYVDDSFLRDAAALKGVSLATVYNRIRRILGLIK